MDRKVLLPPYLSSTQIWPDLMDIVDTVFKSSVDDPTIWLSQLRYLWIQASSAADKIAAGQLLTSADFETPEKEILIRQATQMGFVFADADVLSSQDYQRIVRNISHFWFSKGKPNFIDFMGFVLNAVLTMTTLWANTGLTYDTYGAFLPEGDSGIGTAVWDGGTWFPTTHVRISFDPFRFSNPDFSKLVNLFYSVANFNLVLESIVLEGKIDVHSVDETNLARIAVAYPLIRVSEYAQTH